MGNLRICSKCIMDTTDPDITFDEKGVCNYCRGFPLLKKKHIIDGKEGEAKLSSIIKEIKRKRKGKEYDCLIGLSGGVDSTYVAYLVKKWGLKPLAIHLDNGWDSELSVSNIQRIVEKLNIDLYTYVLDWEEFKDLQLAYFKASVVNLEVPTDHAIPASLYNTASKMGIKYIIIGGNTSSESLMPKNGQVMQTT